LTVPVSVSLSLIVKEMVEVVVVVVVMAVVMGKGRLYHSQFCFTLVSVVLGFIY